MTLRIGTAGWSIPRQYAAAFPVQGSHLERYASRFPVAEINSSFYRPHRPATYARWAASVPDNFRFAVKMPREITHAGGLLAFAAPLDRFLAEVEALQDRLGPILVQLPPKLVYDAASANNFFAALRDRHLGQVVCEPRHASWFTAPADDALCRHKIARVAADPAPVTAAAMPGGWPGLVYRRLHGAPRIYISEYDAAALDRLAAAICGETVESWCIFDNTARGAAANDALRLIARI